MPPVFLKRAIKDCKGRFSGEAVNAVNDFFYVNDFIESVRTVIEASSLANKVKCLLSKPGLE